MWPRGSSRVDSPKDRIFTLTGQTRSSRANVLTHTQHIHMTPANGVHDPLLLSGAEPLAGRLLLRRMRGEASGPDGLGGHAAQESVPRARGVQNPDEAIRKSGSNVVVFLVTSNPRAITRPYLFSMHKQDPPETAPWTLRSFYLRAVQVLWYVDMSCLRWGLMSHIYAYSTPGQRGRPAGAGAPQHRVQGAARRRPPCHSHRPCLRPDPGSPLRTLRGSGRNARLRRHPRARPQGM